MLRAPHVYSHLAYIVGLPLSACTGKEGQLTSFGGRVSGNRACDETVNPPHIRAVRYLCLTFGPRAPLEVFHGFRRSKSPWTPVDERLGNGS